MSNDKAKPKVFRAGATTLDIRSPHPEPASIPKSQSFVVRVFRRPTSANLEASLYHYDDHNKDIEGTLGNGNGVVEIRFDTSTATIGDQYKLSIKLEPSSGGPISKDWPFKPIAAAAPVALVAPTFSMQSANGIVSVMKPPMAMAGDLMLVGVATYSGSASFPLPSGFFAVGNGDNGGNFPKWRLVYKWLDASDFGPWDFDCGDAAATVAGFSLGVRNPGVIAVGTPAAGSDTSFVAPSVNGTNGGLLVDVVFHAASNGAMMTPPAGMTGTDNGRNDRVFVASETLAAAGATGAKTTTSGGTAGAFVTLLVAFTG